MSDPFSIIAPAEHTNHLYVFSSGEPSIIVTGETWTHTRGFFTKLLLLKGSLQHGQLWLVDLESRHLFIDLSSVEDEDQYFEMLRVAPSMIEGISFPYSSYLQAYVSEAGWMLVSDRENESMHFIAKSPLNGNQLALVADLVW